MNCVDLSLGQVVYSSAGRDKGRLFIIVRIFNNGYIEICDGDLRRIENPKLKKTKHIKKTNHIDYLLKDMLEKRQKPANAVIRKSLEDYKNTII